MYVIVKFSLEENCFKFLVRMSPHVLTLSDELTEAFLFPSFDTALLFLFVQRWFAFEDFNIFPFQYFSD